MAVWHVLQNKNFCINIISFFWYTLLLKSNDWHIPDNGNAHIEIKLVWKIKVGKKYVLQSSPIVNGRFKYNRCRVTRLLKKITARVIWKYTFYDHK